jgi:SdpI/YfhL protein family
VIDMAPMTLLLILFLVGGAILIGISIPLIQERVGPNHWYGFRVRRTLEDPEVWYRVNSYSAWRLLAVGVAEIVVATAMYFVPDPDVAVYASIVGGIVVAGLIIGLVQSIRYLQQLRNEQEAATR